MVSKVSEGIEISVETFYQPDYSNPLQSEFMFAYRITIENLSEFTIQLLRRHWHINDAGFEEREVARGASFAGASLRPRDEFDPGGLCVQPRTQFAGGAQVFGDLPKAECQRSGRALLSGSDRENGGRRERSGREPLQERGRQSEKQQRARRAG